eukprot:SAG11_NODE_1835_length_4188_cov_2.482514_2_plen_80_part_00
MLSECPHSPRHCPLHRRLSPAKTKRVSRGLLRQTPPAALPQVGIQPCRILCGRAALPALLQRMSAPLWCEGTPVPAAHS